MSPPDSPPITIRPIRPQDRAAFERGFARLSDRSRYRRFLAPHGDLSPAELRYLVDVDHVDHEAVVAVDQATGEGVGVARYVRGAQDPQAAEMAVAVVDDWQGRGVGTRLLAALADRAREEGIRRFTALVLADNAAVQSVLGTLGTVHTEPPEHGTVAVTVELEEAGRAALARLVRAVARGELSALAPWWRGPGLPVHPRQLRR